MAIRTMSLGEALENGYEVIGPDPIYREEATGFETATSIGLEVIPALIGGIGFGLAGGAGGSAFGNYLSQKYRMSRGLQDEFGLGEFGAATALGGLPVGKFADKSKSVFRGGYATPLQRTAIRAGQGAALATGELTARTFIDEDRAPTPDEVATTLLFGGVFGGTLGAAEAKFLRDQGLPGVEGQKRTELLTNIVKDVKEAGGPKNYEIGRPVGFFTFRDPQGNFVLRDPETTDLATTTGIEPVTALGPRRLRRLDQPKLPGPRGLGGPRQARIGQSRTLTDDGIIEVEAIPVEDYAEGLLNGIENKLLLETEDMVQTLATTQELSPEMQRMREIFERKIASDNEIFTGINPIVAKGNLADTQRLREIDEELKKLDHFGDGKQGDIALGLRRPPTVDPNLTKLSDDAFDAIEIKTRKKLDKLEDNFFNQGGMEQNNLGLKRKLAAAQDDYSAIELEKFRRQIAGEEPWFIASEFRILAGGTQNAETVFKLALLGDVVEKRGIQQELFDELNANVGKDINAQEVFAAQINKAKLAMQKFKGKNLTQKTSSNALRKKLEKEKRALERKHNIVGNVLLGGAGVASVASMFTEEEENELSRAGFDKIIIAGLAALGVGSKLKNKDLIKSAVKGRKQGISEQEQNIVEPERVGKAAVEAESTDKKRILIKDNVRSYYVDELIDSLKIADENNAAIILEELARRSALNTPEAQKIRKKMQIAAMEGDIDAPRSQQLSDPYSIPATGDPSAQGFRDLDKFQLVELARQGDQRAIAEIVRRAEKNPRTKRFFQREGIITGLLTTGTGAIALMEMMEDEDSSVSRAALGGGGLLVALAAAFGGYQFAKKFIKSAEFKKAKAQIKSNPSAAEPDIIKQAKINQVLDRNAFAPKTAVGEMIQSAKDFVSDALVPLSRKLKNINPRLTEVFRNHERQIAKRAREYMDRVSPFIVSMNKRLKNSPQKNRLFKQYLLNGEYAKIRDDILGPNAPQALFDELDEMTRTLDEIRNYARQRGGLDVGYIAQYFPRKIRNYTSFRRALEQQEDLGEIRTELDKALDDYAKKYGFADRDAIPPEEAAEVVSKALRTPPSGGMTPGNVKMRTIESVSPQMLDAYADPADALQDYVQRMVQATERRNFLLRKPDAGASKVGFEGSQDTINADLGMRMEVTDDMIGSLADRLRRENNLSQEDVEKLKEILRARFSSKTVSPFFQGMKNVNYMAVMGNFGSAITQLGDLAYSIHFNGFDNTFKSLFNRKDNFNFVKYFGLSDSSIDAVTSTQGLSSALDKVFTVTGLKKLDQLGKNTFMNASWRKYHNQAKKNGTALVDDLAPVFGRERAGRMVRELQESDPKSNNLPKAVEELIWYKFLDVNPATLGEMPKYYNESGNMRIAYMLKSFTLKQFDVFREAGIEDIRKATKLYSEGKKGEAAKFASKGMKNLLGLAVVFAAANASTDMIKDIMYGRPIKEDDLVLDNALKLVGINRYLMYKARREGVGKAVLETMLPPMTVFDRSSKDLDDFLSGKEYKGNLLQGTPLDIIYWRYLGGVDKVKNMD